MIYRYNAYYISYENNNVNTITNNKNKYINKTIIRKII